ncbi:unnamed protein product, partial [Closterium sp. Naga37s-1]
RTFLATRLQPFISSAPPSLHHSPRSHPPYLPSPFSPKSTPWYRTEPLWTESL